MQMRIRQMAKREEGAILVFWALALAAFLGLVALLAWMGHFWRRAEDNWRNARDHWSMGVCWGLLGSVYGIILVNIASSLFVRGSSLVWALIFAMIASVHLHGFAGGPSPAEPADQPDESPGED